MIGSNTSAQHPLAYARITAAKKRGAKLITVDPRRTPVATLSDIHLAIRPGSNLALVNALMHAILFEEKAQDEAFINERTEHFDALRASLEGCTPEWAAPLTGLRPEAIRETARLYAKGPNSIILYCMGVTQQVTGTRTCGALANLVMLCGMIGRPSTGLIPLRGQNNVQGSCDMGALPETLPGYVKADSRSPMSRARSLPKSWMGCATEASGRPTLWARTPCSPILTRRKSKRGCGTSISSLCRTFS